MTLIFRVHETHVLCLLHSFQVSLAHPDSYFYSIFIYFLCPDVSNASCRRALLSIFTKQRWNLMWTTLNGTELRRNSMFYKAAFTPNLVRFPSIFNKTPVVQLWQLDVHRKLNSLVAAVHVKLWLPITCLSDLTLTKPTAQLDVTQLVLPTCRLSAQCECSLRVLSGSSL